MSDRLLTDEELLAIKRGWTTKDAYDFTRVEVGNLACDIAKAQDKKTALIVRQEMVGEINKILEVGWKQENTDWVKTWIVVKGRLLKLREELKRKWGVK